MNSKTKNIIKEEWIKAFPNLTAYTQNRLYKVVGAFILGIELIKLPRVDNYRPHFAIYPLFRKGIENCLKIPFILDQYYDERGMQLSLPYDNNSKIKIVQNIINNTSKLDLNLSSYKLSNFFNLAEYYLYNHPDIWYRNHPGKRALLFELKLYAALYVGNETEINIVISEILEESAKWNMQLFETWFGNFETWFQNLNTLILNRIEFLKQIDTNKHEKKIAKLCNSELID